MTQLIIKHFILTAIFIGLAAYNIPLKGVISIFLGSIVGIINILFLIWAWQRIFTKKTVALTASAIVFKYAFLGFFVFWLIKNQHVDAKWLTVGFSILLVTMTLNGLKKIKVESESSIEG